METLKIWPRPDEEPNPEADAFLDDLIETAEKNLAERDRLANVSANVWADAFEQSGEEAAEEALKEHLQGLASRTSLSEPGESPESTEETYRPGFCARIAQD